MHYIKWYFWRFFAMFLFFNCTIAFTQNQSNSVISLPSLTVEGASERKSLSGLSLVPNDTESKSAQNIGETLNDQLGFSSSSFGQSANRPIIRGMSGSRVPILQNGSVAGDVSSISADHAVASDVIFNQKIEVLRGGDSLRFSSGANQGLINIIDNRIQDTVTYRYLLIAQKSGALLDTLVFPVKPEHSFRVKYLQRVGVHFYGCAGRPVAIVDLKIVFT